MVSSLADIRALYDGGVDGVIGGALATSNTNLAATAAALADKNYKEALKVDLAAALATATTNLLEATDPSVAKTKKDATDAKAAALVILEGKRDSWLTLSKATVVAMFDWLVDESTSPAWGVVHATDGCLGSDMSGNNDGNNSTTDKRATSDAACKALCASIAAWGMSGNLPTGAAAASGGAAGIFTGWTHCYGVQWLVDTTCTMALTATPTAGSTGASGLCAKRVKSEKAAALIAANTAS